MNTNSSTNPASRGVLLGICVLALAGCRQQMADQPAYRPLQAASFFSDRRASRPLVSGTVARGHLNDDPHLFSGKSADSNEYSQVAGLVGVQDPFAAFSLYVVTDPHVDTFPFPITKKVLQRGQQRYDIFCSMCHDRAGTGAGMIVERGFTTPPSFHIPRLRKAREGYFFQVITRGYGAMPDYHAQIKPHDRWAIIAYIRALQLSQDATLEDVPADRKADLLKGQS